MQPETASLRTATAAVRLQRNGRGLRRTVPRIRGLGKSRIGFAGGLVSRSIAICVAISLVAPWAAGAAPLPTGSQSQNVANEQGAPQDSASQSAAPAASSQPQTSPAGPATQNPRLANRNAEPPQSGTQGGTPAPVGTAVAPYVTTTGTAASSPAGAAVAPAKQRRARSILIRIGLLVGAGIAVGTVVALSSASSSRPR